MMLFAAPVVSRPVCFFAARKRQARIAKPNGNRSNCPLAQSRALDCRRTTPIPGRGLRPKRASGASLVQADDGLRSSRSRLMCRRMCNGHKLRARHSLAPATTGPIKILRSQIKTGCERLKAMSELTSGWRDPWRRGACSSRPKLNWLDSTRRWRDSEARKRPGQTPMWTRDWPVCLLAPPEGLFVFCVCVCACVCVPARICH